MASNWGALPADLLHAVFAAATPPRDGSRGPTDTVLSFEERVRAEVRAGTRCVHVATA